MTVLFKHPELEKRMIALYRYCRSSGHTMPTGNGLELALEMVSHTPDYGKLKSGNKPKPVSRNIHIYLLIEYLRTTGMTKSQATEILQGFSNSRLNYNLGISRLARLHYEIQSDQFGKYVQQRLQTNKKKNIKPQKHVPSPYQQDIK